MHDRNCTERGEPCRLAVGWCLSALLGISAGCSSVDSDRKLQPTYDPASGKLRELSYDSDQDGRFDMKAVMDGNRMLRLEVDENQDGRPDRWEYYEPAAGGSRESPAPIRIERATHRDGRVTRTEGYQDGALAWVEEDRDADGKIDRWETYVGGALSAFALDTRGRGTPERRITWDEDGKWKSGKVEEVEK